MYRVIKTFVSKGEKFFVVETAAGVSVIDKTEYNMLKEAGLVV